MISHRIAHTPRDIFYPAQARRSGPFDSLRRALAAGIPGRMAALAAVILTAALLRVIELGRVGLNSDEAVYSGQASALAGDAQMSGLFSVFRAHPLLFQTLLGGWFEVAGASDLAARIFVAVIFGVGSVILTYMLGSKLYGQRVGLLAAAILAVLPYHVLISRQVLLDSPLAFFVLLTLWFTAHVEEDTSGRWIVWAGLSAGLAAASKEVGVLLIPVLAGVLLLSGQWRMMPLSRMILGGVLFTLVTLPYPLSRILFAPENGSAYLVWQISRDANHDAAYFFEVLGSFGGIVFSVLTLAGLLFILVGERKHRRSLILLWIAVFLTFFQLWPTKLFSYLTPLVPAFSICAAFAIETTARRLSAAFARGLPRLPLARAVALALPTVAVLLLALQLGNASLSIATRGPEALHAPVEFDIEVQDFAAGREMGLWARENTPSDARFLTIGPSIGNLLRYYSNRDSVGLSVSPNPRYRNPAYVPIENPDLAFRQLGIHYIVWDSYSADRSAFYNGRLMYYVKKFGGAVLFSVYERPDGTQIIGPEEGASPRVIVYDAIGGNPLEDVPPRASLVEAPHSEHTGIETVEEVGD